MDFALSLQVVQGAEGLLQRRGKVTGVQLVEVNVVGTEPAQTGLYLGHDVVAGAAGIVRPVAHRGADLGRQHHCVAPALDALA